MNLTNKTILISDTLTDEIVIKNNIKYVECVIMGNKKLTVLYNGTSAVADNHFTNCNFTMYNSSEPTVIMNMNVRISKGFTVEKIITDRLKFLNCTIEYDAEDDEFISLLRHDIMKTYVEDCKFVLIVE